MKLIKDHKNGGLWQWKYFQSRPGYVTGWFDYGPAFESRIEAEEWLENKETNDADKTSSIKYGF